ncbi:MAG: carboxypeptidase regulatory-like domain-containing protein [Acidimicrobiales bacterium]|nr:carboxypeptidase regulatory-like domain-containing protein [Acidimicrobiales bacterium]
MRAVAFSLLRVLRLPLRGQIWVPGGLLIGLVAAGCGGNVSTLSFPGPPSTTAATQPAANTLPGDLSSVAQAPVAGVTTTTAPAVGPGSATLNGTVLGASGPVSGAVVEADRLVGDAMAVAKANTAADGSWSLPNILGGRYRVRAWQSPSLGMGNPQVVFLSGAQTLSVSLQLTQYHGPSVAMAISPRNPAVGQQANLLVQVTNPTVGSDGVLRSPPVVGATVTLVNGSNWQVFNGNPRTTDVAGNALFQVSCTNAGASPLSAQVANQPPVPLAVPDCAPPPTTTVPTLPSETTTTCPSPPGRGSTPTTTAISC